MGMAQRRWRRLAGMIGLAVAVLLSVTASATAGGRPDTAPARAIADVASYNVYLGADLNPLFGAGDYSELVARAGQVYAAMEATDFPQRAEAIADLIAKERPDVVGLQEVAWWATAPGTAVSPTAPFTTTYDFLQLVLDALAERGVPYQEVATNENFTGTLPIAVGASGATWAQFTDRDVIIARTGLPARHLSVDASSVVEANFSAQLTIPSGVTGVPDFEVPRGWSSVDVTVKGVTFTFLNTHLEAFGGDSVRNLQAVELAGVVEAAEHPVVLVGDINSRPPGCSTNTAAFQTFLDAGLVEVWPVVYPRNPCGGYTSGQDADLLNATSTLDHRIDVVMVDPDAFTAIRTEVIGEEQRDRTDLDNLWPSDHAGSVATLKTLRP
jgi:endonuclease/exonuclease/phosphatase family metal-dependent hydrolase